MATISSAGIGSGLDINGIISKLMAVEQQPLTNLDVKEASYQAKLSAFGALKSAVASLETRAQALKSPTLYTAKSVTSSDSTVATASANTAATPGSYSLQVIDLAQSHTIASSVFTSLTDDISTIDGKIKIELGTFSGGIYTPDPDRTPVTIDVAAGSSSLSDIRDAINDANAGVRASIVNVGEDEYKLTLTSTSTGAKQSIRLTTLDSTGVTTLNNNTDIAKLSFDPTAAAGTGKEFEVSAAAQDAKFKVDGVEILRNSNTVSDALTGVTFTLFKAGTSTLKVSANSAAAADSLAAFIDAYNEVNGQLRQLTAYDQTTKSAALLFGDAGARGLQTALRNAINTTFGGGGSIQRLSHLGVEVQRDGSLTFNSSKFSSAMSSSPATVIETMTSTTSGKTGLAVSIAAQLKSLTAENGLLDGKVDGIGRSIEDIGKQRERLNLRLTQIEARYRKQFGALDALVASMQQTSQYLSQQLASLSANSAKS